MRHPHGRHIPIFTIINIKNPPLRCRYMNMKNNSGAEEKNRGHTRHRDVSHHMKKINEFY